MTSPFIRFVTLVRWHCGTSGRSVMGGIRGIRSGRRRWRRRRFLSRRTPPRLRIVSSRRPRWLLFQLLSVLRPPLRLCPLRPPLQLCPLHLLLRLFPLCPLCPLCQLLPLPLQRRAPSGAARNLQHRRTRASGGEGTAIGTLRTLGRGGTRPISKRSFRLTNIATSRETATCAQRSRS